MNAVCARGGQRLWDASWAWGLIWCGGGVDLLELGAAKRPDETQGNGSRTAPT